MTNINCTLDCQYQQDGKCMLDDAENAGAESDVCAYFSPASQKEIKKETGTT